MCVKSPSTFQDQIERIASRGCTIDDYSSAYSFLQRLNYYRLSAYFLPFKKPDGNYTDGLCFTKIIQIYEFDRRMRNLLLSVIEEIEIMLRTQFAYFHAHRFGPLGYTKEGNFNSTHDHCVFMKRLESNIFRNRNQLFVKHHIANYDGNFPIWVVVELLSLGEISYMYADLKRSDRKDLAKQLKSYLQCDIIDRTLESWLRCITDIRNRCAHDSRLYYYRFSATPATPTDFKRNTNYSLNKMLFDYICVLKFLHPDKKNWNNEFLSSLSALVERNSEYIDLNHIGFPDDWYEILHK